MARGERAPGRRSTPAGSAARGRGHTPAGSAARGRGHTIRSAAGSDGRSGHRSAGRPPPAQGRTATATPLERPAGRLTIDHGHAGRRLDKFLRSQLRGVPAGQIFEMLRKGRIRVNGRKVEQNHRLTEGDVIDLPALQTTAATAPTRPPAALLARLDSAVLHEDDEVLVVNKPAGVAVHRGSDVTAGVIEALRHLRPELTELELGHRLDRDTSGVLVLAKTPPMLRHLHEMLRDREDEIERHYQAIVAGRWPASLRELHDPLLRRANEVVVDPRGQRAETHVRLNRTVGDWGSLVDVRLLTGRKHQIRVHLKHAGHPIAGDDRYGDPRINAHVASLGGTGLHLHAATMVIPRPDGTELTVSAPMPRRWDRLLRADRRRGHYGGGRGELRDGPRRGR